MNETRDEAAAYTFKKAGNRWQIWHEGENKGVVSDEMAKEAMLGRIHPQELIEAAKTAEGAGAIFGGGNGWSG